MTNSYDQFIDDVEAFVLDALEPAERAAFAAHLPSCAECRASVESYAPVLARLKQMPIPLLPAPPQVKPKHTMAWRYAAIAAGFAGVVFLGSQVQTTIRYQHSERQYAAIAQMLATDPHEVALTGEGGVTGRAIVGDGKRRTGFIASGLPEAGAGMVYRVWVRGPQGRFTPGTLERTPEGLMVLVIHGDALQSGSAVRITREPQGTLEKGAPVMLQSGTV